MSYDDVFVGQIVVFPFNFAPTGFAMCRGQTLSIAGNTALFSLLGTTYGGDGKSTFALPDLRGRVPVKHGQGPGLSSYPQGEQGGLESVALSVNELPQHAHVIGVGALAAAARCSSAAANQTTPAGNVPAVGTGSSVTYSNAPADANMSAAAIALGGTLTAAAAGGNQPHDNRQPCLALNYCIALQGVFPSKG